VLPDSPLIHGYLADLDKALRPLPPDDRVELRTDIIEHITAALGNDDSPEHIAEVLTALGSVTELIDYDGRNGDNFFGKSATGKPTALLLAIGLLNAAWTAFFFPTFGIPISLILAAAAGWALKRNTPPRRLYLIQLIAALLIVLAAVSYLVLISRINLDI